MPVFVINLSRSVFPVVWQWSRDLRGRICLQNRVQSTLLSPFLDLRSTRLLPLMAVCGNLRWGGFIICSWL